MPKNENEFDQLLNGEIAYNRDVPKFNYAKYTHYTDKQKQYMKDLYNGKIPTGIIPGHELVLDILLEDKNNNYDWLSTFFQSRKSKKSSKKKNSVALKRVASKSSSNGGTRKRKSRRKNKN